MRTSNDNIVWSRTCNSVWDTPWRFFIKDTNNITRYRFVANVKKNNSQSRPRSQISSLNEIVTRAEIESDTDAGCWCIFCKTCATILLIYRVARCSPHAALADCTDLTCADTCIYFGHKVSSQCVSFHSINFVSHFFIFMLLISGQCLEKHFGMITLI